MAIWFVSCNVQPKDQTLKIYHLKPDRISVNTDTIGKYGWYAKTRNDFFAIKNFDATNENDKIKVDSFVVNYLKNDDFLTKNDNAVWTLIFFKYGDGINENTKHEFNTDYTIHKLFAFKKRQTAYSFDNRTNYTGTSYFFNKGDSIVNEYRPIVLDYFKNNNHQ
ncbi:MAG: hypothetical protein CSA40_00045 [Flavobacteriales bacterium]|nr:MAG: hypothetical protein CSA40_00045 [Flavobacteriales bacterium]